MTIGHADGNPYLRGMMLTNRSSDDAPPPPPGADGDLMPAIARRDPTALARLYDQHSPLVFAYSLRSLGDRSDAEDVTLEVFSEIWARYERYDPSRGSPRTYILALTRSRIIDRLRARKRRSNIERPIHSIDVSAIQDSDASRAAMDDEERRMVVGAMKRLSADQRTALEMAFFDSMSHSEIAKTLDTPLGTIKSRIRQALDRMREILKSTDS